MRIRILNPIQVFGANQRPGDVVHVPDDVGDAIVGDGDAERWSEADEAQAAKEAEAQAEAAAKAEAERLAALRPPKPEA